MSDYLPVGVMAWIFGIGPMVEGIRGGSFGLILFGLACLYVIVFRPLYLMLVGAAIIADDVRREG